jgi:hypothetical protein
MGSLHFFLIRIGIMNRVRRELARERLGLRRWSLRSRRFGVTVAVSAVRFGILGAATAKAVTPQTPSPHSKTWRQIRRFMDRCISELLEKVLDYHKPM